MACKFIDPLVLLYSFNTLSDRYTTAYQMSVSYTNSTNNRRTRRQLIEGVLKSFFIVTFRQIYDTLYQLTLSEKLKEISQKKSILRVQVNSFSYKRGIPVDESGHGGGFVFDCRAVHNPGRFEEYKNLTGKDIEVIKFLEDRTDMKDFLDHSRALVDNAVENYQDRKFTHLMVSFGCTGGRHRSVYSAEKIARHLQSKYDVQVEVKHREQEFL